MIIIFCHSFALFPFEPQPSPPPLPPCRFDKLVVLSKQSSGFSEELTYESSVKLVSGLTRIYEGASSRPTHWQAFCTENRDVLPFFFQALFFCAEESSTVVLKLLTCAFVAVNDQTGEGIIRLCLRVRFYFYCYFYCYF